MTGASPLARFLDIRPHADAPRGSLLMALGPETRNSYGNPSGGVLATLVAEAALAASGSKTISRLQVRYLANAKDGMLEANASTIGDDVEVLLTNDGRPIAFGTATVGPPQPSADSGSETSRAAAIRRWDDVPQLGLLDIAEIEASSPDRLAFEMPLADAALTAGGTAHLGALLTLVDLAGGQWAQRTFGGAAVTLDAEVRMSTAVTPGLVRAEASGLRAGRQVATVAVLVSRGDGNHVARGSVSMLRIGSPGSDG